MNTTRMLAFALAVFASCTLAQNNQPTDTDILNVALQLEYLEAQFYSCAVTGQPLAASLTGIKPGALAGCQKANLDPVTQAYAAEILQDELTHVEVLRTALGPLAVSQPAIDIGDAFATALNSAAGATLSPAFSPYANSLFFLHGAFLFEPVGATAYNGAITSYLFNNATYLAYAAGIYGVEAYHAGILGTLLYQSANETIPSYDLTVAELLQGIANLENKADGVPDAQGIVTNYNGQEEANLVPVNTNAMIFARTPAQVLSIVTLGGPNGAGGFFPQGLNGFFSPSNNS